MHADRHFLQGGGYMGVELRRGPRFSSTAVHRWRVAMRKTFPALFLPKLRCPAAGMAVIHSVVYHQRQRHRAGWCRQSGATARLAGGWLPRRLRWGFSSEWAARPGAGDWEKLSGRGRAANSPGVGQKISSSFFYLLSWRLRTHRKHALQACSFGLA